MVVEGGNVIFHNIHCMASYLTYAPAQYSYSGKSTRNLRFVAFNTAFLPVAVEPP